MLTLDRIGRKWSLIIHFGVTAASCFCLIPQQMQNSEWLSISLVFVSRGLVLCASCAIYVYVTEYYPTQVRNTALGWAAALGRMSGMSTTYLSQSDDISYSFFILGLTSTCGSVAAFMLSQDTTGIDLSARVEGYSRFGGTQQDDTTDEYRRV